jgi:aspartate/methionine/tyrosine aminotransferase
VQYACAKALENYDETIEAVSKMTAEYERRKNWLIPALNEVDGFEVAMPEGAFYAFVDVRSLIGDRFANSAEVADLLLEKAHIVVTDGDGFGAPGFLRISYATSMQNLERAVTAMKEILGVRGRVTV